MPRRGMFPVPVIFVSCLLSAAVFHGISVSAVDGNSVKKLIKDIEKRYEKSKRELEEDRKKLEEKKRRRREIQRKLESVEKDIRKLNNTLISIKSKERRLEREIKALRRKLLAAERNLDDNEELYSRTLRSMYKRRRVSPLEMYLGEGSVSTMMRGLKMFAVLAREDVKVLNSIRSEKRTIERTLKKITDARNAQRALAERKRRDQLTLERTKEQKRRLIEEIKRDEEHLKELIVRHQKNMEQAQAEKEKLLAAIAKEVRKRNFLDGVSEDIVNYDFAARKGRLPWPVEGRVVGKFGIVTDPRTKTKTRNRGIEIETKPGAPVYAIGSGIVVRTLSLRGYGNLVWIYHPPNHYTIYAHLSDILVNMNSEVREGDMIGLAGSTGLLDDSSARLLLEVLNGKNPEDPLLWLRPERKRISGL